MKEFTMFTILYGVIPLLYYKIKKVKIPSIEPFLWAVFIASLYEFFGTTVLKINSDYWFVCYKYLAFFSIHYFFYTLLKGKYKLAFILFGLLFLIQSIVALSQWKTLNHLDINAYSCAFQTIIVLFFSIVWFRSAFISLEIDSFTKTPTFYFVSGLILYYSGTVILFLLASFIFKEDRSNFKSFWMLNVFLNLVLRSLLIAGVWKRRQQ